MMRRIAHLRAERVDTARLLLESREVVPPAFRDEKSPANVAALQRRLGSLDRAIADWQDAATRVL